VEMDMYLEKERSSIIKTLGKALVEGDYIYGVIKGTKYQSWRKKPMDLLFQIQNAQAELIKEALLKSQHCSEVLVM